MKMKVPPLFFSLTLSRVKKCDIKKCEIIGMAGISRKNKMKTNPFPKIQ